MAMSKYYFLIVAYAETETHPVRDFSGYIYMLFHIENSRHASI